MIHLLFAIIAATSTFGGTAYDIPEGQTRGFVIEGEPTVEPEIGTVDVDVTPLGGDLSLVTIRCVSSSTGHCTGTVSGS